MDSPSTPRRNSVAGSEMDWSPMHLSSATRTSQPPGRISTPKSNHRVYNPYKRPPLAAAPNGNEVVNSISNFRQARPSFSRHQGSENSNQLRMVQNKETSHSQTKDLSQQPSRHSGHTPYKVPRLPGNTRRPAPYASLLPATVLKDIKTQTLGPIHRHLRPVRHLKSLDTFPRSTHSAGNSLRVTFGTTSSSDNSHQVPLDTTASSDNGHQATLGTTTSANTVKSFGDDHQVHDAFPHSTQRSSNSHRVTFETATSAGVATSLGDDHRVHHTVPTRSSGMQDFGQKHNNNNEGEAPPTIPRFIPWRVQNAWDPPRPFITEPQVLDPSLVPIPLANLVARDPVPRIFPLSAYQWESSVMRERDRSTSRNSRKRDASTYMPGEWPESLNESQIILVQNGDVTTTTRVAQSTHNFKRRCVDISHKVQVHAQSTSSAIVRAVRRAQRIGGRVYRCSSHLLGQFTSLASTSLSGRTDLFRRIRQRFLWRPRTTSRQAQQPVPQETLDSSQETIAPRTPATDSSPQAKSTKEPFVEQPPAEESPAEVSPVKHSQSSEESPDPYSREARLRRYQELMEALTRQLEPPSQPTHQQDPDTTSSSDEVEVTFHSELIDDESSRLQAPDEEVEQTFDSPSKQLADQIAQSIAASVITPVADNIKDRSPSESAGQLASRISDDISSFFDDEEYSTLLEVDTKPPQPTDEAPAVPVVESPAPPPPRQADTIERLIGFSPEVSTKRQTRLQKKKAEEEAAAKRLEAELRRKPFAPLTIEQEDGVKGALRSGFGNFKSTDLVRVVPTGRGGATEGWLNDEVINAYLHLVTDHGNQKFSGSTSSKKYHAFNSFFFDNIRKKGYSGVARWAKRAKLDVKAIQEMEAIFVPINSGNHWTLMSIKPAAKVVCYYDSLGGNGHHAISAAKEWLAGELGASYDASEWKFSSSCESPQQNNMSDCGVFTITTAKMLTLGISPMAYGPEDIPLVRRKIVAELMEGGLF